MDEMDYTNDNDIKSAKVTKITFSNTVFHSSWIEL